MGALSPMHLILILGIAVLILGPKRLPEAGEALGRALREFRDAVGGDDAVPAAAQRVAPAASIAAAIPPALAQGAAAGTPADQSPADPATGS